MDIDNPGQGPKVALVTGSASGLGREFCIALAVAGYRVAGIDRENQEATLADLKKKVPDHDFLAIRGNVTEGSDVVTAIRQIAEHFGELHIVVNNAGIYPPIPFEETTLADWREIMRVNLEGPFNVTRVALPHLRKAGWGRIINIASAAVFLGPPDLVAYTTSKAGLVGFTRALASELGPTGITVNAIAPGLLRTEKATATTGASGGFERVRSLQAIPVIGVPADIVSSLLFLCDERSGFITGQTLNIDGGSAKH